MKNLIIQAYTWVSDFMIYGGGWYAQETSMQAEKQN